MFKPLSSPTSFPHKSLLDVNTDVHSQIYSVLESFSDNDLAYKIDSYDKSIGDILSHMLQTQYHYFLGYQVNGDSGEADYEEPKIESIKEALDIIQENYERSSETIKGLSKETLAVKVKTSWGQEIDKELGVWLGIMQLSQHLGEITVLAGHGGFYKGTLG